jgi:hypothetical protein
MPLRADHDEPFDYDLYLGIVFVMVDGDRRVICRVTKAALHDRAIATGRSLSAVEAFRRYRAAIEAAASAHYDSGIASPVVDSEDLVPIRIGSAKLQRRRWHTTGAPDIGH